MGGGVGPVGVPPLAGTEGVPDSPGDGRRHDQPPLRLERRPRGGDERADVRHGCHGPRAEDDLAGEAVDAYAVDPAEGQQRPPRDREEDGQARPQQDHARSRLPHDPHGRRTDLQRHRDGQRRVQAAGKSKPVGQSLPRRSAATSAARAWSGSRGGTLLSIVESVDATFQTGK